MSRAAILIPVLLAGGAYMVGAWLQLVVLLIAVFLALAAANVANYATEGAAKRQIRGMFGRYLSPAVISQLEENPEAAGLGGKEVLLPPVGHGSAYEFLAHAVAGCGV